MKISTLTALALTTCLSIFSSAKAQSSDIISQSDLTYTLTGFAIEFEYEGYVEMSFAYKKQCELIYPNRDIAKSLIPQDNLDFNFVDGELYKDSHDLSLGKNLAIDLFVREELSLLAEELIAQEKSYNITLSFDIFFSNYSDGEISLGLPEVIINGFPPADKSTFIASPLQSTAQIPAKSHLKVTYKAKIDAKQAIGEIFAISALSSETRFAPRIQLESLGIVATNKAGKDLSTEFLEKNKESATLCISSNGTMQNFFIETSTDGKDTTLGTLIEAINKHYNTQALAFKDDILYIFSQSTKPQENPEVYAGFTINDKLYEDESFLNQKISAKDRICIDADSKTHINALIAPPESLRWDCSTIPANSALDKLEIAKKYSQVGDELSDFHLGTIYYSGIGTQQNFKEALKYYKKASDKGNVWAMSAVADMYRWGDGVKENPSLALEYYKKASENGDDFSLFHLGEMYYFGDGVKEDKTLSFKYFKEASDKNIIPATLEISKMYAQGIGVKKDTEKALSCIKIAAQAGYAEAEAELGKYYLRNAPKDLELAKYWLSKAASKENETAIKLLKRMKRTQ